jgi:hypothetical protein
MMFIAAVLGFNVAVAAELPSWVSNLPLWQWSQIPNTALSSVDPSPRPLGITGPRSKIDAWTGAALKRSGSVYMLGAAGGHADYAGNEVNALALNTANPQWTQLRAPTTNANIIDQGQFYLDLRPAATHSYYGTQFVDSLNRMLIMPSPGLSGPGTFPPMPPGWQYTYNNAAARSFSFNFVTSDWDSPDYVAPYPGGGDFTAAMTVKHQLTGDIYMSRGTGWWKWAAAINSWTKVNNNNEQNYSGAAIDPTRNRMLIVGSYPGTAPPRVRDLNGSPVSVTFGGLGASALTVGGYPGVVYDEANDKFLVFYNSTSGIAVVRVDASTWAVDAPPLTGTRPAGRPNGIQNSVQYVPELGGIVIANSYSGNVFFMRTSALGSTVPAPPPQPIDTTAPSVPTNFSAAPASSFQINLSWTPSTDNVAVMGYKIFRNGAQVAASAGNSYSDIGLSPATAYSYRVSAYDAAGNNSAQSGSVSATTQASTTTPPPSGTPAPPTGSITSLTIVSPVTQSSAPFTVGQAFKQGDVPSGSSIVANIPNFQANIKNTWPDGSARFAVLSGRANLTANTPIAINLSAGAPASGTALTETDLMNTGITASTQVGSTCTVALNNLIGVASTLSSGRWTAGRVRTWVSGPQMSSWIYYSRCGSDPHLAAWFEVRLFAGGAVEVLPWVENSTLNVASPTDKAAQTVTFMLGGTQRYTGSLALPHHTRAVLASGNTFTHWLGTNPAVTPKHDVVYLQKTKMVPTYRAVTSSGSTIWSRLSQTYTPLTAANVPYSGLGSGGYHPYIGPIPEHDVAYLTGNGDPRALASIQANAYAAGGLGIYFRDETTNQPLRFSSYPNLVVNGSGIISSTGASTTSSYTPAGKGTLGGGWTISHHPSLGYMGYLLLGRFFFLEQIQLVAGTNFLINSDSPRQFTEGVLRTDVGANTDRGAAWALRTLLQAAAATPNGETLQTEYLNSFQSNINFYHTTYVAQANNPQGFVKPYSNYNGANAPYMTATWMNNFVNFAWGYGKDLNLAITAASKAKLDAFYAWKVQSIIGTLGGTGATEYYFGDASVYTIAVAPQNASNWVNGTGPWYANWGQIHAATMAYAGTSFPKDNNLHGVSGGAPSEAAFGYWGNLQPAIAYAVTHGATGALEAYNRMIKANNWSVVAATFNDNPVWSVAPSTTTSTTSPPAPTPPIGPTSLTIR